MKKLLHKEGYSFLLLLLLTASVCWVFVLRFGIFGAEVDWLSQHSVLPEYFRQQFYETEDLFPEFAMNLGGGQNLYHFSYYGLYSPVILTAYLLPFMKMSDYMMAAQFVCLAASVMLMYGWLKRRQFSQTTALGTAVLFLLAGPAVYHSYHQIMFVNYMPFLCLGFLGVDRYFEGKKQLLTVSIFLMIMTSFYFSIGGMLVLVLYGIHRYFTCCAGRSRKAGVRNFLTEGMHFLASFFTAVMMSGILLVPTAVVLAGRGESSTGGGPGTAAVLKSLLLPQVPVGRFFYSPYGIGLTTLSVTALAAMAFFGRFHDRILVWSCMAVLAIPVFAYLLNGGLYIRDKVMIPFLPLLCYITACYLRDVEERLQEGREGLARAFLPYLAPFFIVCLSKMEGTAGKYWKLVVLDGAVMLVCSAAARRRGNSIFLLVPSIVILIISGMKINGNEGGMADRGFYAEITDTDIQELGGRATEEEEGFYRMEQLGNVAEDAVNLNRIRDMKQYVSSIYSSSFNTEYQRFRTEIFQTEEPYRNFLMQPALHNPVYLRFMGVKYLISKEELPGYTAVDRKGEWKLYKNDAAAPIAYVTDRIMSEEEYDRLEYPYNQLALLEYAVTEAPEGTEVPEGTEAPEGTEVPGRTEVPERAAASERAEEGIKMAAALRLSADLNLDFPKQIDSDTNDTVYINISNVPEISETKEREVQSDREKTAADRVLFLQFKVHNLRPSGDVAVWAEGVRNKLSSEKHFYYNDNTRFTYTIPLEEGQDEIEMTFGKGRYELDEVKCFIGTLPREADSSLYQAEFHADKEQIKGNVIKGQTESENAGYFITSIPYDENFEIHVDGMKATGERVNKAFLGFKLDSGRHEIEIVYHAPGILAGKLMTAAGVLVFLMTLLYNLFLSKYNNERKLRSSE